MVEMNSSSNSISSILKLLHNSIEAS